MWESMGHLHSGKNKALGPSAPASFLRDPGFPVSAAYEKTSFLDLVLFCFPIPGVCGCCGALRPRYKRLVDNIFPEDPEVGHRKGWMDC